MGVHLTRARLTLASFSFSALLADAVDAPPSTVLLNNRLAAGVNAPSVLRGVPTGGPMSPRFRFPVVGVADARTGVARRAALALRDFEALSDSRCDSSSRGVGGGR